MSCSNCGKNKEIQFLCGNKCGKAAYCSKLCGIQHYETHKIECKFHLNNHWNTILTNEEPKRLLFKTKDMSAYALSLPPQGGLPEEIHPDATQFFLVVEGRGTSTIAGKQDVIQTYSMFYVPPNTSHSIEAASSLKLLTIYSPAEHTSTSTTTLK